MWIVRWRHKQLNKLLDFKLSTFTKYQHEIVVFPALAAQTMQTFGHIVKIDQMASML